MRVHVTGGRGFLGGYVAAALRSEHEVEISDIDDMDVTSLDAVLERLADPPDVVCHLAGLTGAAASRRSAARFFEVNTLGTLNVLEACRRHGIGHVVFLSTLTVHGQAEHPVDEDSPIDPRHPYAASKAAAEVVLASYARSFDVGSIVLRPTLIAGEGQAEPNAVTQFVDAALAGDEIEIFGDGSHRREWLHPEDLAQAVARAVKRPTGPANGRSLALLVSSGHALSMRELAERAIRIVGRGRIELSHPTAQAFSLVTASDRASDELGWRPRIDIDEIVERVAAWRRGDA